MFNGSISPQYHIAFDDMFSTVASSTAADQEVWIRLATSSTSRIQVMLYQEDDPDLDYEWMTANERSNLLAKLESKLYRG